MRGSSIVRIAPHNSCPMPKVMSRVVLLKGRALSVVYQFTTSHDTYQHHGQP